LTVADIQKYRKWPHTHLQSIEANLKKKLKKTKRQRNKKEKEEESCFVKSKFSIITCTEFRFNKAAFYFF